MKATPEPTPASSLKPTPPKPEAKRRLAPVVLPAILGALVIAGVAYEGANLAGGALSPVQASRDEVSATDRQARAEAFAAIQPLSLLMVDAPDLDKATRTMELPEPQRQTLLASMQTLPDSAPAKPGPTNQPRPTRAPARIRLAWLTLWDTDTEDGDAVRIESQGYGRTVTLAKAPVTFAVPVSASGVVRIVGVHDGEGGGITVGLGSGASKAVFPVMTEGQILGLRVAIK